MAENIYEIEGDKLLKSGNEYNAIDSYTNAIAQDPTNVKLYFKLALCYIRTQGDCPKEEYKRIIQLEPESAEAYYIRSLKDIFSAKEEKEQESISNLTKALELNSNFAEAYVLQAEYNLDIENYKKALTYINKAIELTNDDYYYYFIRAKINFQLKDYANAIEDYNKVININPNHAESFKGRSKAKNKIGDKIGAKEDLKISNAIYEKEKYNNNYDDDKNDDVLKNHNLIKILIVYILLFPILVMLNKLLPLKIQESTMTFLGVLLVLDIGIFIIWALVKIFIRYFLKAKNLICRNKK